MLQSIGSHIRYEIKFQETQHPVFFLIPVFAVALFLPTRKGLFLFFTAGVHLPHLILAIPLVFALVVLYLAYNIQILITGKVQPELLTFYQDCYRYLLFVTLSLLYILGGFAPFFKKNDKEFDFSVEFLTEEKQNRFLAMLRFTGLIFILLLPHLAILLILTILMIIFIPLNILLRLLQIQAGLKILQRGYQHYFIILLSSTAFLFGFSDIYPKLFFSLRKSENAEK
mgnify:CR=1 FL=1